jgi:hypothetical protein
MREDHRREVRQVIAFANKNHNLSVVLGSVVYELQTKSADQAQVIAARASEDALFQDLLRMACRATPRVASRAELDARNDDRMRIWTGPYT